MRCHRCAGLMIRADYFDIQESGEMWACLWRCLNCGAVHDPVIGHHQYRSVADVPLAADQGRIRPGYNGAARSCSSPPQSGKSIHRRR